MPPDALAHLGGLRFDPGVGVGSHKLAEASIRGRDAREGHVLERGFDGVEATGVGEEAEEGGMRDRRGRREFVGVMVAAAGEIGRAHV